MRASKALLLGADQPVGLGHRLSRRIERQLDSNCEATADAECFVQRCGELGDCVGLCVSVLRAFDDVAAEEANALALEGTFGDEVVVLALCPALQARGRRLVDGDSHDGSISDHATTSLAI